MSTSLPAPWIKVPGGWFHVDTQTAIPDSKAPQLATGEMAKRWGADAVVQNDERGSWIFSPSRNLTVPVNADSSQDMSRSIDTNGFDNAMMQILPAAAFAAASFGVGSAAAGGAAGGAGAAEGAAAGATAAEGAGAAGAAAGAETGGVLAGAGDMFGSGALYESGAAGLGSSTGGVLGGAGDMFGSGSVYDAGAANLGGATAAPAGGVSGSTSPVLGSGASSLLSNPQVLGMGAGAALGALSGSGTKSGTIQTEEGIPDWLMPYVKPALDKYSTDLQNYQTDPYGIMPSAMTEFKNTIGGMYLDPSTNKYLEDYFRLGAERIKGSLSPSFGHMQAFGQHSGYNEALSRGLGDFSVGLYGGAYEKERDRQNQMTAAAPGFLGQSAQAQFQPYSQYLSSVGALGKSKETPYFTNPWSSILGGAMAGSQFGSMWK